MEEFETELEKCDIKCRWETNREERKREDENVNKEREDPKVTDEDSTSINRVFNLKTKSLDLRNLRATDFQS